MTHDEDVEEMPIWQNHESRITTVENIVGGLTSDVKDVKKSVGDVETAVSKSNDEQKELLNTLIGHHLSTNKIKLNHLWKVILNVTGAGGLLITVIYAIFNVFN